MKEGWEIKRLGEVCTKLTDGSHNPPKGVSHSPYVMLSSQNVFNDKVTLDAVRFLQQDDFEREDKRTCVRLNDVLLTIVGTVGRCAVFCDDVPVTLQRSVAVLRPRDILLSRFLMYCLIGKNDELNDVAHGIAQKGIYLKQLAQLSIPVPPLSEQSRIVEELDCLSGIIGKKKQQLRELDSLAQSIFYEMFGDPVENDKGWEMKKLGEVCADVVDGDHMPPPKSDEGIPFITISNIDKQNNKIDFSSCFYVSNEYYDSIKSNRKPRKGDVLYTVTGSYGIPVLIQDSTAFCFQRHIGLLRPYPQILDSVFLYIWASLSCTKSQADEVATGIAQKTVSLNNLRKFRVIIPPLTLQQAFASKIEAIEKQKELIAQSIKETETLLGSRMQYWFG